MLRPCRASRLTALDTFHVKQLRSDDPADPPSAAVTVAVTRLHRAVGAGAARASIT
jgi:hypothetical protein